MDEQNRRRYSRLNHRAVVRVISTNPVRKYECAMRDFSSGGVFFNCEQAIEMSVGELVEVQTTEFDAAPIVAARIVRVEPELGFAVEFLPAETESSTSVD